jgi:hypothetical protein
MVLVSGLLLMTAGCASKQEWTTWGAHPTHFASGEHLIFSVRNAEGAKPRVTREDLALARQEGWWGQAVAVSQEQILER